MKFIKKSIAILLCATLTVVSGLSACSLTDSSDSGKLSIVTTIFPYYDFAREITGGDADINMLLKPGQESHTYEPTAQDILAIQNCDLFIYTGGENDAWVDDILNSLDKPVNTLKMIDFCDVAYESVLEGMEEEEHHDEDEQETDEHIWTSLKNAQKICLAISDNLSTVDSESADKYSENCHLYCEKLSQLDGEFANAISGAKRKTLVFGDRFPFRYFADDYGLECYAAFAGCSTETEPSAKTLAFLIDKVNSESIPVVLYIEFSAQSVANSIAEQTGCKTALLHSCHNVTQQEIDSGATYLSLMTNNLETIKEALN